MESATKDAVFVQDGTLDFKNKPADKQKTGGWRACGFIFGNEITDRIAYFGVQANLITYLTEVMHQGTPNAARNVNNWSGTVLVITFLGAFAADTYWGRYKTIIVASIVYVSGLGLLTFSAIPHAFRPPECSHGACPQATSSQLSILYFSLYLVAFGSGCMKPCVCSFGADQFDEADACESRKKISFFNWWFWGVHVGILISVTVLIYVEENVGWGLGFGIPTGMMVLAIAIFLSGTCFYRYSKPTGSPLTKVAQVALAAFKKRKIKSPADPKQLYEDLSIGAGKRLIPHTDQFSFLDKAAIPIQGDLVDYKTINPWRLCPLSQIEDTKLILRMMPIWLACLPYSIAIAQIGTLFVRQGSTMDRRLGKKFQIPAASMLLFNSITVFCFIPIYDRILVPLFRKITGHSRGFSLLQRMGIGMFITVIAMAAAALTESERLHSPKYHNGLHRITVFWLLPQYLILGLAEVFISIGQIEFFYDQAPDSMKSLGTALYLANLGVGSFLSSVLITVVNSCTGRNGEHAWISNKLDEGRLDKFYWLLAGLIGFNTCVFVILSCWYRYKNALNYMVVDEPNKCEEL